MELKALKHTSHELELEVRGENETLLNPVIQELLKIKDVEYATIETDHPQAPYRKIYLRLSKESKTDPIKILQKAVKQVKTVTSDFRIEMEKVIPTDRIVAKIERELSIDLKTEMSEESSSVDDFIPKATTIGSIAKIKRKKN